MEILENKDECYGCSACASACPTSAIAMAPNPEGFLEPKINGSLCTECAKCLECCPARGVRYVQHGLDEVYAFATKGKTIAKSSSGGAFSVLAHWMYGKGGYVAGAAFDVQFRVRHVLTKSEDELESLLMSKYVQSDPENCYRETKEALESGVPVLYCGCPCQIAGLRNFLGETYENLVTVDLLCHGVPSPKHLEEYLEGNWGIRNIADVSMRRSNGWGTRFYVKLKDDSTYENISKNDLYLNAFLSDINLRRTCYGCSFASVPRVGDITLGDCWSAKALKLGKPYEQRSSLVMANSARGHDAWKKALATWNEPFEQLAIGADRVHHLTGNKNVCTPVAVNVEARDRFAQLSADTPFTEAAKETLFPYDVGLLLFASDNYGSAATNYALYKTIESLGYRPIVLDNLIPAHGVSRELLESHCAMSGKIVDKGNHRKINALCDTFVMGSDQSLRWNFGRVKDHIEFFLMGFTDESKRRVIYAASSGYDHKSLPEDVRVLYEAMLKRVHAFSVREDFAVSMSERLFRMRPTHVLDPVFLPDKQIYLDLASEAKLDLPRNYLLAYIRYASPEKRDFIKRAAERLGADLIVICDALYYEDLKQQLGMDAIISKPSSPEWMAYYAHASAIVTDSFHGTCFALIFQKEFVSIKAGSTGRFDSLAHIICDTLDQERKIFLAEDAQLVPLDGKMVAHDYDTINRNLALAREQSLTWLRDALRCDVAQHAHPNDEDIYVAYAKVLRDKLKLEDAKKAAEQHAKQDVFDRARSAYKRGRRLAGRGWRKVKKTARKYTRKEGSE